MGAWGLALGLLTGYIIGGLTFLPLLAYLVWTWGTREAPLKETADTPHDDALDFENKEDGGKRDAWGTGLGEDLLRQLKDKQHVPDVASGYFAICREYTPGGINGKPPERPTPAGATTGVESPSVYQSMYRSFFDRNKAPSPSINGPTTKNKKSRNIFYVVLRLGTLMLYDDSEQIEVRHVISLSHYNVSIYGGGEELPEGELWIKRNCIRLAPRDSANTMGDSRCFYFFSDNCSEKEDFYHAMLQSQEIHGDNSLHPPSPLKFNATDLIKLVQQLHASEENLHTRWINALIGRLFLAMYKTKEIENFIFTKVTKKIARVQKPSLISSVKVQRLDMGHLPPFLTNPKLKELTVDGDLTVEADVSYKGNFRIDISAVARIELGSRFKPREVTLVLATILKGLEGHVLIRIKPPPSNRLWITFETPPKMDLSCEPVVSSRQITYGVILRAIENRIREVVNDTLVFPNWDDMPFSNTIAQQFRGGIWKEDNEASEKPPPPTLVRDKHTSLEDLHAEAATSSSDASKSTPALGSHTLHKRRSAQPDMDGESGEFFSSAEQSPIPKPRAMRSGSYASAAIPMLNEETAIFQADDREEKDSAAQSMKSTIEKSPPSSPNFSATSPGLNPRRKSSLHLQGSDTASTPSFDDILSSMDTTHEPTIGSFGSSTSSHSLDAPTTAPKEKRTSLNNQINNATSAAKKWLAARQNPISGSSENASSRPHSTDGSAFASSFDSNSTTTPSTGPPQGPIGRGQPLPPPGTPLPGPPRAERKATWNVPSPSALVNLARRNPLSAKSSSFPPDAGLAAPNPDDKQSGNGNGNNAQGLGIHHLQDSKDSKSSSTSSSNAPSPHIIDLTPPPPALPKRRQRASTKGSFGGMSSRDSRGSREEEQIFVVEAPPLEGEASAPGTPVGEGAMGFPAEREREGMEEARVRVRRE